jgi:hypothetical protein
MEKLKAFWLWLTTSRYVAHLESEIDRLREENKVWQMRLLQSRGLPITEQFNTERKTSPMPRKLTPHQAQMKIDRTHYLEEQKNRQKVQDEAELYAKLQENDAYKKGQNAVSVSPAAN